MVSTLRLQPVRLALPSGFDALRADAVAEGHRMLERLAAEWDAGQRFDRDGEALLVGWHGDALAGIGGVAQDPGTSGALRMCRFYVGPAHRRRGTARALAGALLREARRMGRPVLVNAGTPTAPAFWETLDFVPDPVGGHTHRLTATPEQPRAVPGR